MRAMLIQSDKSYSEIDVNGLTDLQKAVNGYIEGISLGGTLFGYINEEGKLRGLPINQLATRFWKSRRGVDDVICGNLVVVGVADKDGNDTECDVAYVTDILKGLL